MAICGLTTQKKQNSVSQQWIVFCLVNKKKILLIR